MTLHFIYVKGEGKHTPYAIANQLTAYLSKFYTIKLYDWDDKTTIVPEAGDILLGLPHHEKGTIFRNSFWHPHWGKKIIFSPIHHAMPWYNAHLDPYVEHTDDFLAICGKYWIDTWNDSFFSHWWPWITHLDLAVDPQDFPYLKEKINPSGQRKFLYIGNTSEYKGCDYLAQLADANPHLSIGWIGPGAINSQNIKSYGKLDLASSEGRQLVAEYDFLLTCGRSDANPTTILEAASWGLVTICTPQSGYYNEDWFVNIPLYQVGKASAILNDLSICPEEKLRVLQQKARQTLESHYNWQRFCRQVHQSLEAPSGQNRKYDNNDVKCLVNRRHLKKMQFNPKAVSSSIIPGRLLRIPRKILSAVKRRFTAP